MTSATCRVCSEEKLLEEFSKDRTKKNGRQTICRPCASKKSSEYYTKNSKRIRERVTVYSHRELRPEQRTLLSRLKFLCTKARGRNKGTVTIDRDFLVKIYNEQNGLCRYTKLPLTIMANQLNTISLDRIDSAKGYTKDNVQLVCAAVNRMKQEFSEKDFFMLCTLIADKNTQKTTHESSPDSFDQTFGTCGFVTL